MSIKWAREHLTAPLRLSTALLLSFWRPCPSIDVKSSKFHYLDFLSLSHMVLFCSIRWAELFLGIVPFKLPSTLVSLGRTLFAERDRIDLIAGSCSKIWLIGTNRSLFWLERAKTIVRTATSMVSKRLSKLWSNCFVSVGVLVSALESVVFFTPKPGLTNPASKTLMTTRQCHNFMANQISYLTWWRKSYAIKIYKQVSEIQVQCSRLSVSWFQ